MSDGFDLCLEYFLTGAFLGGLCFSLGFPYYLLRKQIRSLRKECVDAFTGTAVDISELQKNIRDISICERSFTMKEVFEDITNLRLRIRKLEEKR